MATAILNGTVVDDGGLPCEGRFQWGTTPGLGTNTPWRNNLRTGDTFKELVHNIPGGTLIYYRAQARNAVGTTSGLTLTFTTVHRIPIVVTVAATNIGNTGATLNGQIIEDMGAGCDVAFEYGGTPSYGNKTPWLSGGYVSGVTFFYDLVGLSPGGVCHFRAMARNKYGIGYGQNLGFGTLSDIGARIGISMELLLLLREDR